MDEEGAFFLSLLQNQAHHINDYEEPDASSQVLDLDSGDVFQPCIAWLPSRDSVLVPRENQAGGSLESGELFQLIAPPRIQQPRSAFNGRCTETTAEYDIKHNLANVSDIVSVAPAIDSFINQLVQPHIATAQDGDWIALSVDSESLNQPLTISFHRKSTYDPQCFLNVIFKKAQSSGAVFLFDGRLRLTVSVIKRYSGSGSRQRSRMSSVKCDSFFARKKDVVVVRNSDHRCGFLAITLGYLYAKMKNNETRMTRHEWRMLQRQDSVTLSAEMTRLFSDLGVSTDAVLNIDSLNDIQSRMPQYQLILVERPTPTKIIDQNYKPLFCGEERAKRIILEYIETPCPHFNFVKKLTGYFNKERWCYTCMTPTRENHLCPDGCKQCRSRHAVSDDAGVVCQVCNNEFKGDTCFTSHKLNGTCSKLKKCTECAVVYSTSEEEHKCDTFKCGKYKKEYESSPHLCFMQKPDIDKVRKEDSENKVIVAFDIETRIVTDDRDRDVHVANLVVSHTVCDVCYKRGNETAKDGDCRVCGRYEHVFFGDDCIERFVSYVMDDLHLNTKTIKRILVFAHNFKGYDGKFIVRELCRQKYMNMAAVYNGTKVTKVDVGKVRFLDSLSFFMLPLSMLPKAFSFPFPIQKGTFPHKFNRPENYNYIGPYPAVDNYEPRLLKKKQQNDFIQWYALTQDKQFNFMHEFVSYCRTDVRILLFAVQEFRALFRQVTSIDPFSRSFTLASVAMETFRTLHLKEDTIGLMPAEGYFSKRNGSIEATAWLDHLQKEMGIVIEREQRIGHYWADGIHRTSNTIFEYYGCFFHGCPTCYPDRDYEQPKAKKTMEQLHYETMVKEEYYRSRGFRVTTVWSCEIGDHSYIRQRKIELLQAREKTSRPLREHLCGGRTENFKLMHECAHDEQLRYLDFTSLYPYVLKKNRFPLGHPVVITEGLDEASFRDRGYFGIVYCKILPPVRMMHPMLAIKSEQKLIFGLCQKCIATRCETCSHTDEERALDSCWTTEEVYTAIECGYKILEIYALLHYERQSVDLFKPYIDMFLKIKQERSGLPADVTNVEEYIKAYEDHENITLDPASIERNEGLRLIAKLLLNSLWGKFVQRPNLPRTDIICDANTLTLLVNDPKIELISTSIINNDTVVATWKYRKDEDSPPSNTSPVIAFFVTAYARLELFRLIQEIEGARSGRVAYVDTDSVIFSEKRTDPEIKCGNYLGELTDELEGSRCRRGFFAGPKAYALELETSNGIKQIVKMKGLSLNSSTEEHADIRVFEKLVREHTENRITGEANRKVPVPQTIFRTTNKAEQLIYTHQFDKFFRVTCDKRISHGYQTYPYGYFRNQ